MSCIICNECSNPLIKVTEKGLSSLNEFSKKRNEDGIYQLLIKSKTENSLYWFMKTVENNLMINVN